MPGQFGGRFNDTYDNTGGSQLRGTVLAGAGNDTLLGGAGRDVLRGEAGFDSLDGGDGNDVVTGRINADVLDGGAGTMDLLDYSGSGAVQVNLALGEASGGDAQGDVFSGFEGVAGGNFTDVLTGDGLANLLLGRFGNDALSGAGGNDNLWGEAGVDLLRGGLGADVFKFAAPSDSGAPGQARDRVLDFVMAQADRIDLSLINANAALAGNQAFGFIGGSAFSAAGQVRTQVISGDTFVFGNTDAVLSTSEFSIRLTGTIALTGSEFIL